MINLQFGQLRNNLTEVAASGELVGELAESWEANADATQWVFNIRKGVEFHNGKTLDSQDVVDSLNHHLGEKPTSERPVSSPASTMSRRMGQTRS